MDLAVSQKLKIPDYVSQQLEDILKYSRCILPGTSQKIVAGPSRVARGVELPDRNYSSLESRPGLSRLISSLDNFRDDLKKKDWAQISIEGKVPPFIS